MLGWRHSFGLVGAKGLGRACAAAALLFAAGAVAQRGPDAREKARNALEQFRREKHYAVVVGIDQYAKNTFPPLQFAVADADAMAEILGRPSHNFEVNRIIGSDAIYEKVMEQLESVASAAGEDATLLFYFAGHGGELDGKQYLASFDASPRGLARGVPIEEVRKVMQQSKARRKILLIDACRVDIQTSATRGVTVERFGLLPDSAGLLILNATNERESSYEEPDFRHGVFTNYVVHGLAGEAADDNGLVYFSVLARYVEDNVRSWVRKRYGAIQDPRFTSVDATGDFLLGGELKAPSKQTVTAAAPPADPVEEAFHRAEAAPNRTEMMRAFATLFPQHQFAPLAEFDAAAHDTDPAKTYFDLGVKFMDSGDHPMARAAFGKVLQANAKNAEAAGYFALELSYDLALNDALAAANSALQLQPGNIPALAGRGFAYFRFGEMNEARADLKRVTASSPTTPRGFETRANAHYMLDEFPAALQDFAEAIRLKSDYGVAYNDRANVYSTTKDHPNALQGYSEALRYLANNPVLWHNRALENQILGNTDAALKDFGEAIRLRPTYSISYAGRANLYLEKGRFEEAIEDCNSALKDKNYVYWPGAVMMRGRAYLGLKKYKEAEADFNAYFAGGLKDATVFEWRAEARDKLNDAKGAAADRAEAERLTKKQ